MQQQLIQSCGITKCGRRDMSGTGYPTLSATTTINMPAFSVASSSLQGIYQIYIHEIPNWWPAIISFSTN
jgi:hypothetical protein